MSDMYSNLLSDTGFYLPNAPTSGTVTVSIQPSGGSNVFTGTSKLILYGMKKILA